MRLFHLLLLASTTIGTTQLPSPTVMLQNASIAYLSKPTDQAGTNKYCPSVNTGVQGVWSCSLSLSYTLTKYTTGMIIVFVPVPGGSGSLEIDNINGGKGVGVMLKDGVTSATLISGEPYILFYDGTVWRVLA